MPLTKLQFRPGINREITSYANEGGWYDSDRIRFTAGYPETIGGWVRQSVQTFLGTCRALRSWRTLDGTRLLGVGTNLKYYLGRGGAFFDITPIRATSAAGAITFAATDGSATLTVSHVGHGALANDFVTYSGAVSLGGNITALVLNREYQVVSVINDDSYTITATATASAADVGNGGGAVVGAYQIPTGLDTSISGAGWGAGSWGEMPWGESADTSVAGAQLRLWSHTAYGEDLVINPRGGGVYYWDRSGGFTTRAVNLTSLVGANRTPTVANFVMLSERDRHLLVFGTDDEFTPGVLDPLLIRFSSQESLTDWESLPTNTAGSLRVSAGSEIVTAVSTRQLILVLTDSSVHTVQNIGPPYTFGLNEIASGISIAGPNAAVSIGDEVLWMGQGEFYRFSGLVQQIPCTVKSYVFDDINTVQYAKVCAGHNVAFGEVWWFYPSADSTENNRYVVYSYLSNLWFFGTMTRTAWIDRSIFTSPIAAGTDRYLYFHETGVSDGEANPPAALNAYVESSPIDLGEGDSYMFISRMLPDITFARSEGMAPPQAMMTVKMRNFAGGAVVDTETRDVIQTVSMPVEQFTDQLFMRLRGRSAILRVSSDQPDTAWRLGTPRVDIRSDGRRA